MDLKKVNNDEHLSRNVPPKEYGEISYIKFWFDLFVEWLLIAAALLLVSIYTNPFTIIISLAIVSIHLHRLAILGHDGAHFKFSQNRTLNNIISNLFIFYPLSVTVQGYQHHHFEHHKKTGTDDDPEFYFKSGVSWQRPKKKQDFYILFFKDMIGLGVIELFRLLYSIRTKKIDVLLGLLVFWTIALFFIVKYELYVALSIYVLSFFTGFWAIFRIRGFSEHVGIKGTYRFKVSLIQKYIFFPYNTWCHYEHHKWPFVSYQYLPMSRKYDREEPILSFDELVKEFEDSNSNVLYKN